MRDTVDWVVRGMGVQLHLQHVDELVFRIQAASGPAIIVVVNLLIISQLWPIVPITVETEVIPEGTYFPF
jgi:hypothetical protein